MDTARPRLKPSLWLSGLFLAALAACESPTVVEAPLEDTVDHSAHAVAPAPAHADGWTPAAHQDRVRALTLLKVKAFTSPFHSTVLASRAGYAEASPCVAAPGLGGMGFHWVNEGLVDPEFEPLRPEAVLYAPDARGRLRLVAVEYVVLDVGQPAPTFAGHPFDVGGAPIPAPHWTLHVWVHKENPSGIFAPFNPRVVCS